MYIFYADCTDIKIIHIIVRLMLTGNGDSKTGSERIKWRKQVGFSEFRFAVYYHMHLFISNLGL